MEINKLDEANKIIRKIEKLEGELDVWTYKITGIEKLGYVDGKSFGGGTDSFRGLRLHNHVPDDSFLVFRESAINYLKVKIAELKAEFDNL